MIKESIIEKIQKLLGLANSPNENEAKLATNKANELLVKYNLSIQEVSDHQSEYEAKELTSVGLTLKPHQKLISSLLIEYFFVKVVIGRKHTGFSSGQWGTPKAQYQKTIRLLGTKENCQIAAYIFSYLNDAYPKLWQDYFDRDAYIERSHKQSYYMGLTTGIAKMLKETRWKVENETGLVVKSDPKLDEFLKKNSSGSYGGDSKSDIDPEVYRDGVEEGKNIRLRKPIESTKVGDDVKLLEAK